MNKYETMYLLKDNKSKEQSINNIFEFITTEAQIQKIELVGRKKLAYDVKGESVGYFVLIEFEADAETIKRLEQRYQREENILKYIILNIND